MPDATLNWILNEREKKSFILFKSVLKLYSKKDNVYITILRLDVQTEAGQEEEEELKLVKKKKKD